MNKNAAALLTLLCLLPVSAQARFCSLAKEKLQQNIVSCRPDVSLQECRRRAEDIGCSVVRTLPSINAVVITLPAGTAETAAKLHGLDATNEVESVELDKKIHWLRSSSLMPARDFRLPPLGEIIRPFKISAEPSVPDEAAAEQPWGVRRVNAAAAWPATQGEGVKIAVIDTGVDFGHPDLSASAAGGFNAVENGDPGAFQDDQGHGTHVAGTIAAARDGKGVVGVAPRAAIYSVKVLDAQGNGTFSSVIAGIEWCVQNGIQVANMSLGASEGTEALAKAVSAAAKAGLTIVAAAGNDYGGPVSFPGAYPEVITVSSADKEDRLSDFSSVGPEVDLIAPGSAVKSTRMGGGYIELSGTSMATPHVAGLAALAVSRGAQGPLAVKAALEAAASPLPELGASQQGRGLVDAGRLLE